MFIVSTAAPVISQPGISLINITPTTLTVSLDTPAVGPTPISFYSVQLFNAATNVNIESFAVPPTSFPFLITGLTNGTTYTVTVTGIESTQNVYASPQVLRQGTTGSTASPPPQVTGLTATATGQTSIQLNWSADSTATSYTITRTGGLSPNGATITGPGSSIIDSSGNVWTLGNGVGGPNYSVYLNGSPAAVSYSVTLLLYYNNLIYQETASNAWFSWNGSGWTSVAGDPRGTSSVPAPAAAVGYNTQTFNSLTVSSTIGGLYPFNYYGETQPGGAYTNSGGQLLIPGTPNANTFNATVSSANINAAKPQGWQGTAFGGGFFAMCTFSMTGTPNGGEPTPSFWFNDIEHQAGFGNANHWGELDVIEANASGLASYGVAFHDYSNAGTTNTPYGKFAPTGLNLNQSNTFAALCVPATATTQGYAQFWCNPSNAGWQKFGSQLTWNQYSAGEALPASGSNVGNIMDVSHWFIIIGNSNSATPMTVTSCQIWQASAANNLTA